MGHDQRAGALKAAFSDLLLTLLMHGSGLQLGPDCDGQVNLCDDTHDWSMPVTEETLMQVSRHTQTTSHSRQHRLCGTLCQHLHLKLDEL